MYIHFISFHSFIFIGCLNAVNNRKEKTIASHVYQLLYSTKQSRSGAKDHGANNVC